MDKYALMKMFNHDRRLQSYMYVVISVDPETIIVEDYFPTTNKFVENTRNFQLQYQYQNIGLDSVSYIQKIMSLI